MSCQRNLICGVQYYALRRNIILSCRQDGKVCRVCYLLQQNVTSYQDMTFMHLRDKTIDDSSRPRVDVNLRSGFAKTAVWPRGVLTVQQHSHR